ncbi:hypothetical protein ACJ73_03826 [Blastomyces percursus]|uniref:Grh/CP2 DB domain-containing protein n=1 Tax=Blastomyces percursus TaxID=1658174 RepID=A0A1J9R9Z0_9EURO|nr:hypothetical protein ACJ73_03826 [Blastomyces percursus]
MKVHLKTICNTSGNPAPSTPTGKKRPAAVVEHEERRSAGYSHGNAPATPGFLPTPTPVQTSPAPPTVSSTLPVQNRMISTASKRMRNTRMTLTADRMVENSPINGVNASNHIGLLPHGIGLSSPVDHRTNPGNENFQFNVTLKAATAMVKDPDEIPITYLDKDQAYTMSILDTAPMTSGAQPLKYRTFIHVSFEDDERRSKPASYWQLWKESRGFNEAHHRAGKLLTVEHVDLNPGGDIIPSQIHLETSNFDGFSFVSISSPPTLAIPKASREFLFAYAPCAKTEVISTGHGGPSLEGRPEVCYCKVQLFHPHGTERKLSKDVTHVKKLIDKLKQQISLSKFRSDFEEDFQTYTAMLSSTRPFSALNLKGDAQDVHLGMTSTIQKRTNGT